MIEERPSRLLTALESRIDDLLDMRHEARVQHQALRARLSELEQGRQTLEASKAESTARAEAAQARQHELEARLEALEARLIESEGARLELAEENRELDEQNRELEAHNQRLQARLDGEGPTPVFQRPHRQAKGLSALIGHHRPVPSDGDDSVDSKDAHSLSPSQSPSPPREATPQQDTPAQSDLPIGEPPSPQALLAEWYQRYADTFFKGHTRPLQVGIHEELAAREPWPEKLVRRALACYVNLPRYLKSVREGAERIDLSGAPAGQVDHGAAEHARKKLERLQAERRRKGKPAKRVADKREAATRPKAARRSDVPARNTPPPVSTAAGTASVEEEPDQQRLQRKLGELMARHNGR
ncbi:ProQ/FINO family protein [Halomonas organivorans]|uniref:ProP effector n=1 Tax=Halomonas organivorans TaxID=257772 RepID=A0A7W5C2W7_9GAMM|nr:ProQ/FINO family protein [Halomonas organivorans]MBB3143379.1 ProP effector [Halomonas organivorans]